MGGYDKLLKKKANNLVIKLYISINLFVNVDKNYPNINKPKFIYQHLNFESLQMYLMHETNSLACACEI